MSDRQGTDGTQGPPRGAGRAGPGRAGRPAPDVFCRAFEAHPAAQLLLDPENGRVVEANPAACAFFGRSREDLCGLPLWRLLDRPLDPLRRELLAAGRCLARLRRAPGAPDGEGRAAELAAGPVDLDGRSLLHCLLRGAGKDCPEPDADRHRRLLRRTMLDSVRDALALKDADSVYRAVNRAFCDLLGRSEADIVGRGDLELFPEAQAQAKRLDDDRVRVTGESMSRDELLQTPRGPVWVNTVKSPVRDAAGNFAGVILSVRDITRRKRMEEALRRSEEEFRAIADYGPGWESWLDPLGRLLWVNPAVERHTGYSVLECLSMTGYPLGLVDPEDRAEFGERLRRALEQRLSEDGLVFRIRRRDGSPRWMAASWQPISDASGRHVGLRMSVHDFTERRQAELLREDIERIVRHDLKGPLTSMVLVPQMLRQEGPVTARQEVILVELERAAQRMLTMINRSLDLYKMEAGTYRPTPAPLDLAALCRESLEENAVAAQSGVVWEVLVEGKPAGSFTARGEEGLLRTMLDNLARNAFEAAPPDGRVALRLSREPGRVRLELSNSGEVPPTIRERLFTKYATAGKRHGTGLGAYSARLAAEAHGGSIAADTSLPGRTTITVLLPD